MTLLTLDDKPNNLPSHKGQRMVIAAVTFSAEAGLPFTQTATRSYPAGNEAQREAAVFQAVEQLVEDVGRLLRHERDLASKPHVPGGT